MIIQHKLNKNFLEVSKGEQINLIYLIGAGAFKNLAKGEKVSSTIQLMDDPDTLFEYCYCNIDVEHPTNKDFEVTLEPDDRAFFIVGWEIEQERYYMDGDLTSETKELMEKYDLKLIEDTKEVVVKKENVEVPKAEDSLVAGEYPHQYAYSEYGYDDGEDLPIRTTPATPGSPVPYVWPYKYEAYKYVEPTHVFKRFEIKKESTKKIVFPKEISDLLFNIFSFASGKEIMFYGELVQDQENTDLYTVTNMNFPPQKNFGGYVETVDEKYEMWVFNEIIRKGKRVPLHVHTHPDFSAFSSSIDEIQIEKFIADNVGNPFIIQLIISNPRKGTYFARWFDLVNNTCEKPTVEFLYDKFDVEAAYPGIFQFDAPRYYETYKVDDSGYYGKAQKHSYVFEDAMAAHKEKYNVGKYVDKTSHKGASVPVPTKEKNKIKKTFLTNKERDKKESEEDIDIFEKQSFDAYYARKYGFKK
jgi:proteasome lid subunit RPN8/RPN11